LNFYKLIIAYDGSEYFGWQKQTQTSKTIQGELEKALIQISKSTNVYSLASGRTDAKVHAINQHVLIRINLIIEPISLLKAINSLTSNCILVKECIEISEDFNPVRDALKKEYKYYFQFKNISHPYLKNYITVYKHENINIDKLNQIANLFIGEHDFKNFFTVGTPVKSTIRTIYHSEVRKIKQSFFPLDEPEEIYEYKVIGNGFMKQMVRLLIGTIIDQSEVDLKSNKIRDALSSKLDKNIKLGAVSKPNGLYLSKVWY